MPQELSLPHLLACLAEKDRYKGTQVYLSQVQRQNEEIYPLINAALLTTLLQLKTSPMSRLLSLRFFKEILITANFSLIDAIDQKIEEHVISVAQYNKKSKEVNRGANFFSDVYNVKNDGDVQKISSSYVLLALQIVAAIGKWYLADQDGEETRFVQYLLELTEAGVTFPSQLNFFKKDEEEKFKKNYQKWAKGYKISNESMKNQGKKAEPEPEAPPKITNSVSTRQEAQQANQPKELLQDKVGVNETPEFLSLKQKLSDKEEAVSILQSKLKQEQEKSILLQSSLKTQETAITKLQAQLKAAHVDKEKPNLSIAQECYKIFISPPKNSDDLIEEIDSLKEILEKTTTNYQQEKQHLQSQIKQLKSERDSLKENLQKRQERVLELQQQLAVKQLQVNNKKQPQNNVEASLLIIDQPKAGSKQMYELELITIKEKVLVSDRKEEVLKDFSNSNKLIRQKLGEVSDKKIKDASSNHSRQGSRSLKKTEPHHRQKVSQAASTSNFMKMSHTQSKLIKTAQGFRPKEDSGKLVTIFPFLEKYFPEVPSQCQSFKMHCLSLTQPSQPFFQNQWIKAVLIKRGCEKCFLQVSNKTTSQQKIKVVPTHPCLSIQGEKIKKVPSNTVAQFQMKMGLPDLNMRCPMVSIIIGNHGISLTTSINEKIFHIPLPVTLLDFFSFKKPTRKATSSKTVKYGANRFILASGLPNLQRCFPALASQYRQGESMRVGQIEWCGSSLHLQLSEWSRQLSISVQLSDQCPLSSSIGKVLLQILMYLLKD